MTELESRFMDWDEAHGDDQKIQDWAQDWAEMQLKALTG